MPLMLCAFPLVLAVGADKGNAALHYRFVSQKQGQLRLPLTHAKCLSPVNVAYGRFTLRSERVRPLSLCWVIMTMAGAQHLNCDVCSSVSRWQWELTENCSIVWCIVTPCQRIPTISKTHNSESACHKARCVCSWAQRGLLPSALVGLLHYV